MECDLCHLLPADLSALHASRMVFVSQGWRGLELGLVVSGQALFRQTDRVDYRVSVAVQGWSEENGTVEAREDDTRFENCSLVRFFRLR